MIQVALDSTIDFSRIPGYPFTKSIEPERDDFGCFSIKGRGDFYNLFKALEAADAQNRKITLRFTNLKYIPAYAFYDNKIENYNLELPYDGERKSQPKSLVKVIADKAESIGYGAFVLSESLTSIEAPMVTEVAPTAFLRATALTNINLPKLESVGLYAFKECDALTSLDLPALKYADGSAFMNCKKLTRVNLPECIYLGGEAFKDCYKLKSVSAPKLIKTNSFVFYNCFALKEASFPNLYSTAHGDFYFCRSLTDVRLPKLEIIGTDAFSECTNLERVLIATESRRLVIDNSLSKGKNIVNPFTYSPEFKDIGTKYMSTEEYFYKTYGIGYKDVTEKYLDLSDVKLITGKRNGSKVVDNEWIIPAKRYGQYKIGPFYGIKTK